MSLDPRLLLRLCVFVTGITTTMSLASGAGPTPQSQPSPRVATVEELGKRDGTMAQRLRIRDDLARLTDALQAQLGEKHPSVRERRTQLAVMDKEIADYTNILRAAYTSRAAADELGKDANRGLIAVPAAEDWAKIDAKLHQLLNGCDGLREVITALTGRYGAAHESVLSRKEELRLLSTG